MDFSNAARFLSFDKERIYYAVHDNGVIYVAYITNPDVPSYHGMPWRKRGNQGLPRSILKSLREKARKKGALTGFEDWLKEHGR